jgi:hypothetical protein
LSDFELGAILLGVNLLSFAMVFYWGYGIRWEEKRREKEREAKVQKVEPAVTFSKGKFGSTLTSIVQESLSLSELLCFHYTTSTQAHQILRMGLPASAAERGVVFSLHAYCDMTTEDRDHFLEEKLEVMLVVALPRRLLVQLRSAASGDSSLRLLPSKALRALRSSDFSEILAPRLWVEGHLILPPHTIRRAYQVERGSPENAGVEIDVSTIDRDVVEGEAANDGVAFGKNRSSNPGFEARKRQTTLANQRDSDVRLTRSSSNRRSTRASSLSYSIFRPSVSRNSVEQLSEVHDAEVHMVRALDCHSYLRAIDIAREACKEHDLVPIFHYTLPSLGPLILSNGFRMSTQGQGDGGVYFSTLSPASYELGSEAYEDNIITDCFGKERMDEYRGKHKLDLLLVYGIEPSVLQQAPGGRNNAKMVSKKTFEDLTLPHADGSYYLRPDRIFAAIIVDPSRFQTVADHRGQTIEELLRIRGGMKRERRRDVAMREVIEQEQLRSDANDESVKEAAVHVATETSLFPLPLNEAVGVEKETANAIDDGHFSTPLSGGDWMGGEEMEVGIDGDDDFDFPRDMHASVHERMSALNSLEGGNPLMKRSNNLQARGMTMDEKPRGVSFGGVSRLSTADEGGDGGDGGGMVGSGFARGSLGVGGMRDSRNSSTALRPSMMHARSSELNKRLQSMKASEDTSTTGASGGGRGRGGGGRGGRGGRRSSNSNSSLLSRGSASSRASTAAVSSSSGGSDAFGAIESTALVGPWTEHFDAASGKPYWHNTDTRETTWEKPDSLPMRDETEAVAMTATAASEAFFARKSVVRRKTKHRVGRGLSTGTASADGGSGSDTDAESSFI